MMRPVGSGGILIEATLEENLAMVRDLGFHEIDILLISGWAHVNIDELAADYAGVCGRIEKLLSRYGLAVASVNAKYSVKLEDEGAAEQRQRELDALLRFMKDFGTTRASIQPTLTGDAAYLERTRAAAVKEAHRQIVYARERGMSLSVEPHVNSCLCHTPELKAALREYPDFAFTYDPSHLIAAGEEIRDLDYLARNTAVAHLRDARPGELFVPCGEGTLDIPHAVGALKRAGYDGPVAIEYLSDKPDATIYEDMGRFVERVTKAIRACQET